MPKERNDYMQVRLSPQALAKLGADAQLRISNAHSHYLFAGNAPTEIMRTEWAALLSRERLDDDLLFEAVPATVESTT